LGRTLLERQGTIQRETGRDTERKNRERERARDREKE
jgi:hypothetical protein